MSSEAAQKQSPALASHFGVYALIFNADESRILLIKKALGCYTGLYDLPGGTMEPHELLEETLCRETLEETACTVTSFTQLGTFSTLYPFKKDGEDRILRHIGAIYRTHVSGTPRVHATGLDDSDGCVWLELADVTETNAAPLVIAALKAHAEKT